MISTKVSAFAKTAVAVIALSTLAVAVFAAGDATKTPRVHGKVTAVSSTSITLHSKKDNTDTTFAVTSTTKVKVDKVDSTIDKVLVGMRAAVKSADGKTADVINARTGGSKKADAGAVDADETASK